MAALVMGATISASASAVDYYKDRFNSIGWGGSDGSLHWSGPWAEINDDGDAKKGSVRVVSAGHCASGNCMRIAGLLAGMGASRTADTDDLEELSFSYDLKNVRTLPLLNLTKLVVEARGDGGWVEIAEHDLGDGFSSRFTVDDLDGFSSDDFGIRFTVVGAAMTSEVYIDNVEVVGVPAEEPATTTTTVAEVTTTTVAVTTTTSPSTTTTSVSSTSTTRPPDTSPTTQQPDGSSTSTTATSTTVGRAELTPTSSSTSVTSSTTTPIPSSTSSSSPESDTSEPGAAGGSGAISEGSGIRAAARGLQASFQGDLFGEARTVSSLGGVDLQAEYTIAAEVIRSSWAWMVLLGLVIAWAIVSGLDRRRHDLED
jgi:hypothetical protein